MAERKAVIVAVQRVRQITISLKRILLGLQHLR